MLIIIIIIIRRRRRRWRNLGISQRSENFESVCVMLQKIIEHNQKILRQDFYKVYKRGRKF